jgi:alpha-beta hydrolase superfamily lysophospholipase
MEPTVRTHDGLALHGRRWPARGARRGTIVIVHGLGEHVGRYEHVAASLNGRGWGVVAFDQRGHGQSEGERGRLGAADDLLADLAPVLDRAHADEPRPLVLLGHSMGGTVAARYVAGGLESPRPGWYRPVDALVLSSPALETGMSMARRRCSPRSDR